MKIAFLSTILGYRWGGADTLWTRAAEASAARGDTLFLGLSKLTSAHSRVRTLVRAGAQLFERSEAPLPRTPYQRVFKKFIGYGGDNLRLTKKLDGFKPDLVLLSCGGTYCLSVEPVLSEWLLSKSVPFRLILNWQSEHPVLGGAERERIERIFEKADKLFFVSNRNLAVTRAHLLARLDQACVVHNPLREFPEKALPWPATAEHQLAFLGRLEPVKGLDLLIHALADVLSSTPGWKLNLFGEGSEAPYLRRCAQFRGIEERVVFRGYEPDLNRIWSEHHLLLSPSIDDGVPMTIPEAMLRGRPVLAANIGGVSDWLVPNETGFVCEAPTVPLFSRILTEAWLNRETWPTMGLEAAKEARARYRPNDFLQLIAFPAGS